jgi:DNA modification methylase
MATTQNAREIPAAKLFHETRLGEIYLGDSLALFRDAIEKRSVDLIMTSPPFGLVRKKDYGNVDADKYVDWFRPFAAPFKEALKTHGKRWNHAVRNAQQYLKRIGQIVCGGKRWSLALSH